jgi:hypothetical protein
VEKTAWAVAACQVLLPVPSSSSTNINKDVVFLRFFLKIASSVAPFLFTLVHTHNLCYLSLSSKCGEKIITPVTATQTLLSSQRLMEHFHHLDDENPRAFSSPFLLEKCDGATWCGVVSFQLTEN